MNLLQLLIPSNKRQTVTEVESWTVEWRVLDKWGTSEGKAYNKAFISHSEAIEFERQVKSSADFIKAWVRTSLRKN